MARRIAASLGWAVGSAAVRDARWPAALFACLTLFAVGARLYDISLYPSQQDKDLVSLSLIVTATFWQATEVLISFTFCATTWLLLRVTRRRWARAAVYGLSAIGALAMLALNLASGETIHAFGTPPTLGMLVYSDVLMSENGRIAVSSWIPAKLQITAMVCAALAAAAAMAIFCSRTLAAAAALLAVGVGAQAGVQAITAGADDSHDISATASFLSSFRALNPRVAFGPALAVDPFPPGKMELGAPVDRERAASIDNIVLVVLESAAAEYFDQYGGRYAIAPELSRMAPQSLRAQHAYANAASSTQSLGVMLTSRQPAIGINPPRPTGPMLPEILRSSGMRTGFFHSSDVRYGQVNELLAAAGYQHVSDFRGRKCAAPLLDDRSEFNSQATLDACTFRDMTAWIVQAPDKPFFATLWTFQSHYPYFATGGMAPDLPDAELEGDPETRAAKSRYLAALSEADREIGNLITFLREKGLAERTLVVVTGDHGEGFRQHGQIGHGGDLHEEAVHVPLFLIQPGLSPERKFDRIVSHLDLAPTITDLLGLRAPPQWEGRSMFRARAARPAFFATPWTDLVVGYRLGDRKVIARLLASQASVYDLAADPAERHDLAAGNPQIQRDEIRKMQAWGRLATERAAH